MKVETNERFDRLTNLDISTHYRDREYWLMKSDFMGAFAYWVIVQSPYEVPDIHKATQEFSEYLDLIYPGLNHLPVKFSYEEINKLISENAFESLPEIEILNHKKIEGDNAKGPDYDFIDLCALARNVTFMIMRESITQ